MSLLIKTLVRDGVHLFTANSGLVNSTVLEQKEYLIVIDTMLFPHDSKELSEQLKLLRKPVKYIINTHWHSDHCYGNKWVAENCTVIIAQNSFLNTIKKEKNLLNPNRPSFIDKYNFVYPDITFEKTLKLKADYPIEIYSGPGHSEDSSYVYLPEQRIVICGDTVLNSTTNLIALPYFYWGNSQDLLNTLQKIHHLKCTDIITGHGNPVADEKILQDIHYLENLLNLSNILFKENTHLNKDSFLKKLQSRISVTDCLESLKPDEIWVKRIHELNLEKLAAEFFK